MQKIMTLLLIALVRAYQVALSPYLGKHCRFTPTCSHYAIQAFQAHGVLRGFWLTIKRLMKCHPWHAGGYDSVPK